MKDGKAGFLKRQYGEKIKALALYRERAQSLKKLLDKGRYEAAFDLSKSMADTGRHIETVDKCLSAQQGWKKDLDAEDLAVLDALEAQAAESAAVCADLINALSCDIKKSMKETEDDLRAFARNRKKFQSLSESSGKARILDIKT